MVFSFIRKRYQDPMAPSWFFHSLICAFHFGSWRQAWPDYGRPEGSPKEVKMRSMARLGLGLGKAWRSPREVKMRSFGSNFWENSEKSKKSKKQPSCFFMFFMFFIFHVFHFFIVFSVVFKLWSRLHFSFPIVWWVMFGGFGGKCHAYVHIRNINTKFQCTQQNWDKQNIKWNKRLQKNGKSF